MAQMTMLEAPSGNDTQTLNQLRGVRTHSGQPDSGLRGMQYIRDEYSPGNQAQHHMYPGNPAEKRQPAESKGTNSDVVHRGS